MNLIQAFTTTRRDGNARDTDKLNRILRRRRLSVTIATAKQVHGQRLIVVPELNKAKRYPGVDGLLTAVPDQPLGIFTADCASIFLAAPSQGVVGLLHAGWRGVHGGILSQAVQLMRRRWRCHPQQIRMWLGPRIGPCCFEVRWDVARHFPAARRRKKDRWVVDLAGELRRQARKLGIVPGHAAPGCTRHQSRYHSFRRDQTNERQISVIVRRTKN